MCLGGSKKVELILLYFVGYVTPSLWQVFMGGSSKRFSMEHALSYIFLSYLILPCMIGDAVITTDVSGRVHLGNYVILSFLIVSYLVR